jgi:3-ketosteroid 9alpha-monooxygenase subunit A
MAKPALSMKPTGWFQVLWSAELAVGEVKRLHYFDQELVAWRDEDGLAHVMSAYCEHLGAHLGHGGKVKGNNIQCPFHGWEWSGQGRNTCIPYQDKPNRTRRIPTFPVAERNESIYIWHDLLKRDPFFDVPDVFDMWEGDEDVSARDYYRAYPEGALKRENLTLHPQFVAENGVDYAHFKYVHRAADVPRFTRREFNEYSFRSDFEMWFGKGKESTVMTPDGATLGTVSAISCGIGLGFSKFSGPDNMRTFVSVTPVDDEVCDIRSTSWLDRVPGDDSPGIPETLTRRMRLADNQFLADVAIWQHQRYTSPPGLATAEAQGFRDYRQWAMKFYPPGELGSAPEEQTAGLEATGETVSDEPQAIDLDRVLGAQS